MIRLIIISDIRLYADGLAEILDRSGRISTLSVANTVDNAIDDIQQLAPDVVLLDMTIANSCESLQDITSKCPATRMIALSVPKDANHIHTCAEAGIAGYVAREDSIEVLLKAIENSLTGDIYCPSHLASYLFRQVGVLAKREAREHEQSPVKADAVEPQQQLEQLTRRERQIAGLLSHGLSNKQIARDLSIELSTVKNHVHNILVKVGAHSRTQAVLILQNSLLSPGSRSLDLELHY